MKKLSYYLARYISNLFIPPTLTVFIFTFLAINYESEFEKKIFVILISVFFGFIFPVTVFIILRKKGRIGNNDATVKEERSTPYFIGVVLSLSALICCAIIDANIISTSLWFAYGISTLLLILINRYWKMSAHAIGIATPFAVLMILLGFSAWPFLTILLLVGWSRIKLGVHTLPQVIGGSIYGFFVTYLIVRGALNYF